jgi:hypothetical protein
MTAPKKKADSTQGKKSPTIKKRLYAAAEHMYESREQFGSETLRVMAALKAFNQRLRSFDVALDLKDEAIAARLKFTHTAMDSLARLVDVLTENTAALTSTPRA